MAKRYKKNWRTQPKVDHYQKITDQILDNIAKTGTVPWQKPWNTPAGAARGIDGKPYRGINSIMTNMQGYSDPRWATINKIKQLGGMVKQGEKSTMITFFKPLFVQDKHADGSPKVNDDGEKILKKISILKTFAVFNVEQADIPNLPKLPKAKKQTKLGIRKAAEDVVKNRQNPAPITHNGGDRAYYLHGKDEIHMPPKSDFKGIDEYYDTLFHEIGHSTGHESRLNRHEMEGVHSRFGDKNYSKEELVAEFTGAFLGGVTGIKNQIQNNATYIKGWSRALKADKKLVIRAAGLGQKAADYILEQPTK